MQKQTITQLKTTAKTKNSKAILCYPRKRKYLPQIELSPVLPANPVENLFHFETHLVKVMPVVSHDLSRQVTLLDRSRCRQPPRLPIDVGGHKTRPYNLEPLEQC
jgi:hypothetical protein